MFLYTVIEAAAAVVAGILIAVCAKRADGSILHAEFLCAKGKLQNS